MQGLAVPLAGAISLSKATIAYLTMERGMSCLSRAGKNKYSLIARKPVWDGSSLVWLWPPGMKMLHRAVTTAYRQLA